MANTYLLRDIDPELFSLFKSICVFQSITVKDSLIKYMLSVVSEFDFSDMVRMTNSINFFNKEE